jgi:chromosome segregation ATPase
LDEIEFKSKIKSIENLNNEILSNFLFETNNLFINYEKETENLSKENTKKFLNLEFCNFAFNFEGTKNSFSEEIKSLINSNAGVMEVTLAYNYKIEELVNEVDSLKAKLKESQGTVQALQFSLEKAYRTMEMDNNISFKRSKTINEKGSSQMDNAKFHSDTKNNEEKLRKDLFDVKTQLTEMKMARDKLYKDNDRLKTELIQANENKSQMEKDLIGKLNTVMIDSDSKVKIYREDLSKANEIINEKENVIKTTNRIIMLNLESFESKMKELFNLNNSIIQENENWKQRLHEKQEEYSKLFEEKKNIVDEISSKTDGLNEYLKDQKDKLEIETVELKKQVEDLRTQVMKLSLELQTKSNITLTLDKTIEDSGLCDLDNLNSELQKSKEREKEFMNNIQELSSLISNLEQERHKTQHNYTQLKDEYDKLEDIRKLLEDNNAQLNANIEELNKLIADYEDRMSKDQLRIKDLTGIKAKLEEIYDNSKLVKQENNELKNTIEQFKKDISEEQGRTKEANAICDEKQTQIDNLNSEVTKRDKIIVNLNEKLEESKCTIEERDKEIFEIKDKNTIYYVCSSVDDYAITKELMIDHIYSLYLFDNSINLQDIIQYLLNNFSIFLNTIFLRRDNFFSSYTLIHEFLEDLFFKIFDACITYKVNKIKEIKDYGSKEFWLLNPADFEHEIIKQISEEFFETNILSLTNGIIKSKRSIDDIIRIFIESYEYKFDLGNQKMPEYIEKEIRPRVLEKIEKNKGNILNELKTLIEFSIVNIRDGKICYNNKEIYDYKEFFVENISKNMRQKQTLEINHNLSLPEAMDSLVYTLKYQSKDLKKLFLNSNFDGNSEFPLAKTVLTLLFYSPSVSSLRLTESMLNQKQLCHLTKLFEFSKCLISLDLSNNNISDEGIRLICEYLKINKTIKSVNLNKNNLNQNSGFYIADMLMKNNIIEDLYLGQNQINDAGVGSLITVLINYNKNIKTLDLSNNALLLDDYNSISELITANKSLVNLNLSRNQIDIKNASVLGYALKASTKLSILSLTEMGINDDSFPLIIKNLNDSRVTELYLDYNIITNVVVLLGNHLKTNNHLKVLSLKKCGLNSMSLLCLCKALEVNDKLEALKLEDNVFDETALTALDRSVRDKTVKIYLSSIGLPAKYKDIFKGTHNIIVI